MFDFDEMVATIKGGIREVQEGINEDIENIREIKRGIATKTARISRVGRMFSALGSLVEGVVEGNNLAMDSKFDEDIKVDTDIDFEIEDIDDDFDDLDDDEDFDDDEEDFDDEDDIEE